MNINQEHHRPAALAETAIAPAGTRFGGPPKNDDTVGVDADVHVGGGHRGDTTTGTASPCDTKKLLAQPRDAPSRVAPMQPAPLDAGRLDCERIAANALLSGASLSSTFGVGSALTNMAMLHPHPLVKVAGGYMPMLAGSASSYTETWLRDACKIDSTTPHSLPLLRDAAIPVASMLTNYAYMFSTLPKFSPRTPAGVATSVAVSVVGSGIGGGLAELFAQTSHPVAAAVPTQTSQTPTTSQTEIGRSLTQLPAMMLNHIMAVSSMHGAVPRALSRAVPLTVGAPLPFLQSVTPATPQQTSCIPHDLAVRRTSEPVVDDANRIFKKNRI